MLPDAALYVVRFAGTTGAGDATDISSGDPGTTDASSCRFVPTGGRPPTSYAMSSWLTFPWKLQCLTLLRANETGDGRSSEKIGRAHV